MRQDKTTTSGSATGKGTAHRNNGSPLSAEMDAELKKLFRSDGPQPDETAVLIARDMIEANPAQPRQRFDPHTLRELGDSMRANGQLQECIVRPHPTEAGHYQLIAGERRWRAAAPEYGDIAQLRCVVRDVDDAEALVLAIEENAKREDINPIERAQALINLKNVPTDPDTTKGMTWEEVARKVGLTRAAVDRFVQLLKLPEPVLEKFQALNLNEKHGRGLLLLKDNAAAQTLLLREIEEQELSGNQALNRAGQIVTGNTRDSGEGNVPAPPTGASPAATPSVSSSRTDDADTEPSSGSMAKEYSGGGNGSGITLGRTSTAPEESVDRKTQISDPLLTSLKPAIAHLAEGHRELSRLKLSADYRQRVRHELDMAQKQIDELRSLIE